MLTDVSPMEAYGSVREDRLGKSTVIFWMEYLIFWMEYEDTCLS
jgi:hypothetical protein